MHRHRPPVSIVDKTTGSAENSSSVVTTIHIYGTSCQRLFPRLVVPFSSFALNSIAFAAGNSRRLHDVPRMIFNLFLHRSKYDGGNDGCLVVFFPSEMCRMRLHMQRQLGEQYMCTYMCADTSQKTKHTTTVGECFIKATSTSLPETFCHQTMHAITFFVRRLVLFSSSNLIKQDRRRHLSPKQSTIRTMVTCFVPFVQPCCQNTPICRHGVKSLYEQ